MKKICFTIIVMLILAVTTVSCEDEVTISETGTIELGADDGIIIDDEHGHLLSLATEGGYLHVSSIFSNVSRKPAIAYMGHYASIEEIPYNDVYPADASAKIENDGGYLVSLSVYRPELRQDSEIRIRMYVRVKNGINDKSPSYLINYQIIRIN